MKKKLILCIVLSILALGFFYLFFFRKKTIELQFGMFVGSNWGVAIEDSYKIIDRAIAKFEDKNPQVKVHYYSGIRKVDYSEWLSQQALLGHMPDVFMVLDDDFYNFASKNLLKDLSKLLKNDANFKIEHYYKSIFDTGYFKNKIYALPYEVNMMLMAVNKTLLKQYHYDIPQSWGLTEFYDIVKNMTIDSNNDGSIDIIGEYNYQWEHAVYGKGHDIFDKNGTTCFLASSGNIEAIQFMQKLSNLKNDQIFGIQDFDKGRVAFMPISFAHYKTYTVYPYKLTKNYNFDLDAIPMPSDFNNLGKIETLFMGISKNTQYEKLAYKLLKTFTHDVEIQELIYKNTQGVSPLKTVIHNKSVKKIVYDIFNGEDKQETINVVLEKGEGTYKFRNYNKIFNVIDTDVNKIIQDKKNADISLKSLQRTVNAMLEK